MPFASAPLSEQEEEGQLAAALALSCSISGPSRTPTPRASRQGQRDRAGGYGTAELPVSRAGARGRAATLQGAGARAAPCPVVRGPHPSTSSESESWESIDGSDRGASTSCGPRTVSGGFEIDVGNSILELVAAGPFPRAVLSRTGSAYAAWKIAGLPGVRGVICVEGGGWDLLSHFFPGRAASGIKGQKFVGAESPEDALYKYCLEAPRHQQPADKHSVTLWRCRVKAGRR
jgi:hypothetical protein